MHAYIYAKSGAAAIEKNGKWVVVDFYKVKHLTIRTSTHKRTPWNNLDDAHKGLFV